jgi:aromatic ring-opening dioxygenase catalytic subunit (LigB family)
MYPEADIPVVSVSLVNNHGYDPEFHFNLGIALGPFREQGVLILGSGYSYHNLEFMISGSFDAQKPSVIFDKFLQDTLLNPSYTV